VRRKEKRASIGAAGIVTAIVTQRGAAGTFISVPCKNTVISS